MDESAYIPTNSVLYSTSSNMQLRNKYHDSVTKDDTRSSASSLAFIAFFSSPPLIFRLFVLLSCDGAPAQTLAKA